MTLVSKAWYHAYTPFLYSLIPLQNLTQDLAFLTPESKAALLLYRQHIRVFRTRSTRGNVIQQFLNTLVLPKHLRGGVSGPAEMRLTELYLMGDKFRKNGNDCVLKILEACSSTLRKLQLNVETLASNQHQHLLPLLRIISDSMTQLQHLCLFRNLVVQIQPFAMRCFLETCPSSLVTLTLGWFHFPIQCKEKDEQTKDPAAVRGAKPHPNLKVFSLGAGYSSAFTPVDPEVTSAIFVRFLQSCSSDIKTYGINSNHSWEFIQPEVTDAVATLTGTRPRYFQVDAVEFSSEEDQAMADEVSSLWRTYQETPNNNDKPRDIWTSIKMGGCPLSSPITFNAILESCQHGLQNLQIHLGEGIANKDLQTILHTGTALRRLTFKNNWPSLDFRVMLQSTWNCTLLTELNIQITNIPRPDVLFDWKGDRILPFPDRAETTTTSSSSMEMDESRRIQRKIYTRLATLVNLESLQLGGARQLPSVKVTIPHNGKTGSFHRSQQLDCLEMSLDSGLDILSGMKSLRKLYVHRMEHRIGIREMKWFEREFPEFQSLFGIEPQTTRTCLLYDLEDPDLNKCGVGYEWS
ncbi:hypothetical protein EC957_005720 [Mortierella hygrophila]|uniref:Uncharacterized protein n=1 Tax=Mortierella hygrophila TaxID=979708 RepID=A0A9P6K6X8_9FUNG|nr:hypothetical protein EC957_005720 [Mortierella hygrophila]